MHGLLILNSHCSHIPLEVIEKAKDVQLDIIQLMVDAIVHFSSFTTFRDGHFICMMFEFWNTGSVVCMQETSVQYEESSHALEKDVLLACVTILVWVGIVEQMV